MSDSRSPTVEERLKEIERVMASASEDMQETLRIANVPRLISELRAARRDAERLDLLQHVIRRHDIEFGTCIGDVDLIGSFQSVTIVDGAGIEGKADTLREAIDAYADAIAAPSDGGAGT